MLVFKLLQNELDEAKQLIEYSDWTAPVCGAEEWVELLERIDFYVRSFAWYPKSPHKRELKVFLQCRCSYQKAAQKCNVSERWLYKVVGRASAVLEQRFAGVLKALRQRNILAVEQEFRMATGEYSTLFESVVRPAFHPAVHEGMDLDSCSEELTLLRWVQDLEDDMVGLDRSRIGHLLYILLEQDPRYQVARQYLSQCMEGSLSVSETLNMIARYEASMRPIIVGEEG